MTSMFFAAINFIAVSDGLCFRHMKPAMRTDNHLGDRSLLGGGRCVAIGEGALDNLQNQPQPDQDNDDA